MMIRKMKPSKEEKVLDLCDLMDSIENRGLDWQLYKYLRAEENIGVATYRASIIEYTREGFNQTTGEPCTTRFAALNSALEKWDQGIRNN